MWSGNRAFSTGAHWIGQWKKRSRETSCLSIPGFGPEAPEWIYSHGVPAVKTEGALDKHLRKWDCYPYYLAPEYKTYFQRLITEFGKHIRSYPKEKQERIAFIQVKTGCTGDEVPYKGVAVEKKYDLPKSSPEWREFRLATFAQFVQIFQENPANPELTCFSRTSGLMMILGKPNRTRRNGNG